MGCKIVLGIRQSCFLSIIGYFRLIMMCNQFNIYENIKYTKKVGLIATVN